MRIDQFLPSPCGVLMEQEDFENQAQIGECPTCAVQKRHDDAVRKQARLAQELDQGKKL